MDHLEKVLKIIWQVIYHALIPMTYLILAYYNWNQSKLSLGRLELCNGVMLFLRLENSLVVCSFIQGKKQLEVEFALLQTIIFALNAFSKENYELNKMNSFETSSFFMFFFFFWLNISALILITSYTICYAIMQMVRNVQLARQQQQQPRKKGLTEEEINGLKTYIFGDSKTSKKKKKKNQSSACKGGNTLKETPSVVDLEMPPQSQGEFLKSSEDLELCSICLQDYVQDDCLLVLPQCQHNFHEECIKTWLIGNSKCPFCRQQIILSRLE